MKEPTEEEEAGKGKTDNLIRHFTSVWKQDPRIQEFEADGSQRDRGGFARKRKWDTWICGTALWGRKKCTREMACILVEGGASVFAERLSGAVASGLGKVRYLN